MENALYFGDNLEVLRERIPDESVDLIYLDPPFNSKADYNIVFRDPTDGGSGARIKAFGDSWCWGTESERALAELEKRNGALAELIRSLGESDLSAYLVMMTARLVELHRVLKPTGSLYLHCDPTASHYLKVILDQIFGPRNFRSEVIWKRTNAHSSAKRWGPVHDVILFYTKNDNYTWNRVYQEYGEGYLEKEYRHQDERGFFAAKDLTGPGESSGDSGKPWRGIDPSAKGRHWAAPKREKLPSWLDVPKGREEMSAQKKLDFLDKNGLIYWPKNGGAPLLKRYREKGLGVPIQDVILDIPPLSSRSKERLGYPTQKPLALLKRIIEASSNPGDVVLDPFCGSGTALAAAQELGRRWIGIDASHLAITLTQARLKQHYRLEPNKDYALEGAPKDAESAHHLFLRDLRQFRL